MNKSGRGSDGRETVSAPGPKDRSPRGKFKSEFWSQFSERAGARSQDMAKDYKRFRSDVKKGLYKVTITISDEAVDWFYHLSRMMKKKRGYKLPRSYIIRALINVCMKLEIGVEGVKGEKDLEERILDAIKRYS